MLVWILNFLPLPIAAQGFAGLARDATGFAMPDPDYSLNFPQDHGPHPAFRIEWWYLTATLQGADGRDYGVQWTLFRSALEPRRAQGWQSPQMWMGHAALTTPDRHYFTERLARGGIGQAGVTIAGKAAPFEAWIDEWRMTGASDLSQLELRASGPDFSYDLQLSASGPLVLHGQKGYSVKSADGQASHYYSQPSYRVTGSLQTPEGAVAVTGQGWLDREWSSQPLAADQTGWDWFSLSFDDGARMMAFALRGDDKAYLSGTWIDPDGRSSPLSGDDLQLEPLELVEIAGRKLPVRWRVVVRDKNVDVEVSALNNQAWMATSFPYWEGPVAVSGSHEGRGYLEMTGY